MRKPGTGGLVYSTESGRMCPTCRQPTSQCLCGKTSPPRAAAGKPRVTLETKGRGGKAVTVIRGLNLDDAALILLGKQWRTACGTGGTVKDGIVELQGDHGDKVRALLSKIP